MPVYEYKCENCESTFTVVTTMAKKAKGFPVACRMCKSERGKQIFLSSYPLSEEMAADGGCCG
ncbi:MAG: FmdB family zinc ribbon protein [Spirochaetota bacterium]